MGHLEIEYFLYPQTSVHIHLPRETAFQGLQADKKWQVINGAFMVKYKWHLRLRKPGNCLGSYGGKSMPVNTHTHTSPGTGVLTMERQHHQFT